MGDTIELQEMERTCQHAKNSETLESTVMVSLRKTVITIGIFVVLTGTMATTAMYIYSTTKTSSASHVIHFNDEKTNAKLQGLEEKFVKIELTLLITNLQLEYLLEINQNVSPLLYFESLNQLDDINNLIKQKVLQTFDDTQKPLDPAIEMFRSRLSSKMDKLFIGIRSEHEFRRLVSQDWELSNYTKKQLKILYDEEFQAELSKHDEGVTIPLEINLEFHKNVSERTISKAVDKNLVPLTSSVSLWIKNIFNAGYRKKIAENAVIGIDIGNSWVRSFVYYNDGKPNHCFSLSSYVQDKNDSDVEIYFTDEAKNRVRDATVLLPIYYDLQQIIRDWDYFNTSSEQLFWTFAVQQGIGDDGPLVSSPTTGAQHTVKNILFKLFQKIKEKSGMCVGDTPVKNCVITVPREFDEKQKKLVLDAGKLAGFEDVTLLEENFALALTLEQINGPWKTAKTLLFVEINQLTWKVSILQGFQANYTKIIGFSMTMYTEDFCTKIGQYSIVKSNSSLEAKIRLRRFYEKCEAEIMKLSYNPLWEYFYVNDAKNSRIKIYRLNIEKTAAYKVNDFIEMIDDGLKVVNLTKEAIDGFMLGGKYDQLWLVKDALNKYFDGRNMITKGYSSGFNVAYGAAVKGAFITAEVIKKHRLNTTTLY